MFGPLSYIPRVAVGSDTFMCGILITLNISELRFDPEETFVRHTSYITFIEIAES